MKPKSAHVVCAFIVKDMIDKKRIDTTDVFHFIKNLADVVDKASKSAKLSSNERKDIVMSIIRDVAKGKDGILGTADDLLPLDILRDINDMMDTSMMDNFVGMITELIEKKRFNLYRCFACVTRATVL